MYNTCACKITLLLFGRNKYMQPSAQQRTPFLHEALERSHGPPPCTRPLQPAHRLDPKTLETLKPLKPKLGGYSLARFPPDRRASTAPSTLVVAGSSRCRQAPAASCSGYASHSCENSSRSSPCVGTRDARYGVGNSY